MGNKDVVVRQINLDGNELWDGGLGLRREGEYEKIGGEILAVGEVTPGYMIKEKLQREKG